MNGKELLEKYPKVAKFLKEWYVKKMMENMTDLYDSEEIKQQLSKDETVERLLTTTIDHNPSALFAAFDTLNIYVGTIIQRDPITDQITFSYGLCPKGDCIDEPLQTFSSRKDMEYYAMLTAVQYIDSNFD